MHVGLAGCRQIMAPLQCRGRVGLPGLRRRGCVFLGKINEIVARLLVTIIRTRISLKYAAAKTEKMLKWFLV